MTARLRNRKPVQTVANERKWPPKNAERQSRNSNGSRLSSAAAVPSAPEAPILFPYPAACVRAAAEDSRGPSICSQPATLLSDCSDTAPVVIRPETPNDHRLLSFIPAG